MIRVIRIISKYCKYFAKVMNQTYREWYEFDVNVVRILIATCTYKSMSKWVWMNQSRVVKFQYYWLTYIQNFMSGYEYRKTTNFCFWGQYNKEIELEWKEKYAFWSLYSMLSFYSIHWLVEFKWIENIRESCVSIFYLWFKLSKHFKWNLLC